jgi:hypothetical protein
MEGRDWTVVPTQMITEGVHNGSDGPIFYPADELAKLPDAWNHKPVMVYHPKVNGKQVSACDPIQLTTRKVGVMLNTKWDGEIKKLGTETWLDPARMNAIDERIPQAIKDNEMMEVSTGLFMDLERTPGEFEGKEYIGIARNMQPDHLALLPDQKGACSIEDGAGFLRNNEECRKLIMNEMSHGGIRQLLSSSLRAKKEEAWVEDVFDDYFIYEEGGRYFKQDYTVKDGIVSFVGLPKVVERKITYEEVTLATNKEPNPNVKGEAMEKEKIVDALIENERTSWTEEHRKTLMGLEESVLTIMQDDAAAEEKAEEKAEDAKPEAKAEEKAEDAKPEAKAEPVGNAQPPKPQTAEEYIQNAPPEIRESLEMGLATLSEQKARLIESILANERNTFTKEHLETMKLEMLQHMAQLAAPVANEAQGQTVPLYIGQQDGNIPRGGSAPEPLLLPTMNCGDEKKSAAG